MSKDTEMNYGITAKKREEQMPDTAYRTGGSAWQPKDSEPRFYLGLYHKCYCNIRDSTMDFDNGCPVCGGKLK